MLNKLTHRFNTVLINISSLWTFLYYANSERRNAHPVRRMMRLKQHWVTAHRLWLSVVSRASFCARDSHCASPSLHSKLIIVFLVLSYLSYVAALLLCYTFKINVFLFYSIYLYVNVFACFFMNVFYNTKSNVWHFTRFIRTLIHFYL